MKLFFVTGNKHKILEAKSVFSEYNIEIDQLNEEKYEDKEKNIKEIAEFNAKYYFNKFKKPIIVDDTGIFFRAYPNFPGNHPKLMFNSLGYKGLLKLLENEDKTVTFKTIVSFYDGIELKSFTGELECIADTKVNDEDKDVLPYERIFLVEGKSISSMTREEKNNISHRAKAFRKLALYLNKRIN